MQKVMPYSEQFYIGGANSIRAFQIRSIGPGSYHPDRKSVTAYLDQTGDIKLEANIGYRFKIAGRFLGAVFAMPETSGCCEKKNRDREENSG